MEEMFLYLNHHEEIKEAVLLVGENFQIDKIDELMDQAELEVLTIVGNLKPYAISKIEKKLADLKKNETVQCPSIMKYVPVDEFNTSGDFQILLFDALTDLSDLMRFTKSSINNLVGNVYSKEEAFEIWEQFYKSAEHVYIKTDRGGMAPQILKWDRSGSTGIELSVIFPVYNVGKYLEQCLKSVTAWDAEYVEFLFVNDGSPDNSRDIILQWAAKDSRIKLIDKENGGCASARQKGLEHARGSYIGFVDPDDFVDKSMFRKLLSNAMAGSYDICYCKYNEYYDSTRSVKEAEEIIPWPFLDGCTDPLIIHQLIAFARVAIWRGVYKASMIRSANIHFYTDLRRFDDLPFKVETFAAAKSVLAIPEHLYYYRLQRPGQDMSANDDRLYVHFDIFNHLDKSIAGTKDPRLIDWLQLVKLQTHRFALSVIKDEFVTEYMKRAKEDLDKNVGKKKSFELISHDLGKKAALYYLAIETQSKTLLKLANK